MKGTGSSPELKNISINIEGRRPSRRMRKSRQAKTFFEYQMPNPFTKENNQNQYPHSLVTQFKNQQYITPKCIDRVGLPPSRRTSNFAKKLLQMKSVARKQEEKYNGMVGSNRQIHLQEEGSSINLDEEDDISLRLNMFYDENQCLDEEINIFGNHHTEAPDQVVFYSTEDLGMDVEEMMSEEPHSMDDEYANYFT